MFPLNGGCHHSRVVLHGVAWGGGDPCGTMGLTPAEETKAEQWDGGLLCGDGVGVAFGTSPLQ